jgi:hypothetical protein
MIKFVGLFWMAAGNPQFWLKKLGMSEYPQRFAENDIDIAMRDVATPHRLQLSQSNHVSRTDAQNLGISHSKAVLSRKLINLALSFSAGCRFGDLG